MKANAMFVNGKTLLDSAPLKDMEQVKIKYEGTSYGLSEAGYDIRLAQTVNFYPPNTMAFVGLIHEGATKYDDFTEWENKLKKAHLGWTETIYPTGKIKETIGRFVLVSAIEEFDIPANLVATIKDKSTWARQGLSVYNTVAEPQWTGFLTMELVFQGNEFLTVQAGQGIAQVLFGSLQEEGNYADGKYQNQENMPVPARA